MKRILGIGFPLLLSGCALNQPTGFTQQYCEVFTPIEQTVFRHRMDELTHPHELRINCFHQGIDESD